MEKEKLEEELKTLTTKYNMITARIARTKEDLIIMSNEALLTKGAIEQTNKLLAFYNNESNKEEEK